MSSGPPPQRRPGDRDGFDRRADPHAHFLGAQSNVGGGGGIPWMVLDAIRRLVRRRSRKR